MASTAIHFSGQETPEARLVTLEAVDAPPRYAYITVDLSGAGPLGTRHHEITLYLPQGEAGPSTARRLAAVLLKAAEEHEAYLATSAPLPETDRCLMAAEKETT